MSNRSGPSPDIFNLLNSLDSPVGTSYRDQWKARQEELAAEAEALSKPAQPQDDSFFQRSAGELAGDIGSGLAKGVNSVGGAIVQTGDASVELSNKFNPLMVVMKHYFPERVAESEKLYTNVAEGVGDFFKRGEEYWQDKKSDKIKADAAYVSGGEGFADTFSRAIDRPQVIPDLVADSAAYMLPGGWAARAIAATGASKAVVATGSMGVSAALDAGATGVQTKREVLNMTPEQLMERSPDYKALIASGIAPQEAKLALARDAGFTAQAIQLPISFLASKLTGAGKVESDFFTGQGVKNFFSAIAKETAEEGIQESSAQIATNIGVQQNADETRSLTQDVGKNAALGMIAGGAQAGGMKALGAFVPGQRASDQANDDGVDSPINGEQLNTGVDTTTPIPDGILQLNHNPERMITMPDGTTAWESELADLNTDRAAKQHPSYAAPIINTGDQSNPDDRFKFELNPNTTLRQRTQALRAKRREEINRINRTVDFAPVEIPAAQPAESQNIDSIEFTPPATPEPSRFSLAPLEQSRYDNGVDFTPQSAGPSPSSRIDELAAGIEQEVSKNNKEISSKIDSARNARMPENLKDTRLLRNRYRTHLTNVADSLESNAAAFSSPDSLLDMVAKNGGLNAAAWASEGIDPADAKASNNSGFSKVFRKNGGMTPDDLAEFAHQNGFTGFSDAQGNLDANAALNAVSDELSGNKRYSLNDEMALQAAQNAPAYVSELKEFGSPEAIKRAITLALEGKKLGSNQLKIVQEVLNNTNAHSRDDKAIKEKWADRAKTILANRGNKELNSWRNRDEHEADATTHEAALNELMTEAIENYGIDPDAVKNAYRKYAEKYPSQGQLTAAMTSWVSANKPNTSEHLSYEQQNRKTELPRGSSSQRGAPLSGTGLSPESQGRQAPGESRVDAPSSQSQPGSDSARGNPGLRQPVDFALESQTEESAKAESDRLAAIAKAEEESKAKVEQKAQADLEVGSFALSGSKAPSDVAASYGQNDMFVGTRGSKSKQDAGSSETRKEGDNNYISRNGARIAKVRSAKNAGEIDAVLSDEYADSGRWFEATNALELSAREKKKELADIAAKEQEEVEEEFQLASGKLVEFELVGDKPSDYVEAVERVKSLNESDSQHNYSLKRRSNESIEYHAIMKKRKETEPKQEAKPDGSGDVAPVKLPKEVHLYTSNKDYASSKKYFKRLKSVNGWGLYQDPRTNDYILLTETYKTDKFSSIEDALAFAEKHQTVSKLSYMDAYNKRLMPSQPESKEPRPSDGVSVSGEQESAEKASNQQNSVENADSSPSSERLDSSEQSNAAIVKAIPPSILKNLKVDYDVYDENTESYSTQKVPARDALKSVNEDIETYNSLLKCVRGG